MFTQNSFIRKNTKELQDKLKDLGYEEYLFGSIDLEYLCTSSYKDGWFDGTEWHNTGEIPNYDSITDEDIKSDDYGIDCGTNENLFFALAALRDDSDYMQWFVVDKYGWWKCNEKNVNCFLHEYDLDGLEYHKATVGELIKYFNRKQL